MLPFAFVGWFVLAILFAWSLACASGDEVTGPNIENPVLSPDGTKLLFVSDAKEKSTIWSANRDGSDSHILIGWQDSAQRQPDWSPDGARIAFSSDRGSKHYDIWTTKTDGSEPLQLTHDTQNNGQPRYSPDGKRILFLSTRTGKKELWTMAKDGTEQKAVGLQPIMASDPAWSPDGTHIAYTGCTRPPNDGALSDGTCNIYTIDLGGGPKTQVTPGHAFDTEPDWGADGIVFASADGSIRIVDSDGKNLRSLTHPRGTGDWEPRWHPASRSIVFIRIGNPTNLIIARDLKGNEKQIPVTVGP